MRDCVFCKIIRGEIPSRKLYEDGKFVVILDKFPGNPGHALVIPKEHAENLLDLPDETAAGVLPLAKRVAAALDKALAPVGINILQNNGAAVGQSVMHYHLHVVPRFDGDSYRFGWRPAEVPGDELNRLAARIGAI
ncbi:MAG: HIT family protein [Clostridiales bacterium]|jgi:histidine triad (HIT) family protein|nr:HIT family protein [Clostridiales bacterium]